MYKNKIMTLFVTCLLALPIIKTVVTAETTTADLVSIKNYILAKSHTVEQTSNNKIDIYSVLNIKKELLNKKVTPEYPIDTSVITEAKGTIHTGDGTFYGGGYEGGCAMLDPVSTDYLVAAMNLSDYDNARLAGAFIEVTGERGSIKMLVTDLLPEGKKGDLDLNVDAFPLIADPIKGRVPVSWKIIPLETTEPVSYKFKEGSSAYWCGVQVRNHRYPVAKFEYKDSSGNFVELKRQQYNYFEKSDGMGEGPFTFRVTDIYGDVIIDENITLTPNGVVKGKSQFPI